MHLEHYSFTVNETVLEFSFDSIGPKGSLKKRAVFSPQNVNGITYFNLAFGDLNEETGELDDLTVSDNEDREKVLATVAVTVVEFLKHFPDMAVYVKGSTAARTRLYQMRIAANWNEIELLVEIFGFMDGHWGPFSKNINYEAFLALKRK